MRRTVLVVPAAFLTTACATRPWTPSAGLEYWSEPTPTTATVMAPSQQEAIAKWQLPPTNPWARYMKYTLLTALDSVPRASALPDVTQLDIVRRAQAAGARVAAAGLPNDAMWVVDLRGAASVAFGAGVSGAAAEPVSNVLTFNNWPADNELIPAEEALSALVQFSPRPPSVDVGTRPVFLLDAWRLAYRFDEPDDDVTDNRYILSSTDLPDASSLRNQGIRRVVYVVESLDDTSTEEDDLHGIFAAYQAAGIEIYMVDLGFVDQPIERERWIEVYHPHVLYIEERRTIIDDPGFYARARGGFGGVHGGVTWHSGGGGGGWHVGGGGGG
jgi:hypothetical protein